MAGQVIERIDELTAPSPMMAQYIAVKREYADFVLLYRLGDFYEMFFEDAVTVSRALELTLTGRDCGGGLRAAMCGVPFHKSDLYIGRLVECGFKVAVCEQTEDPATAKGLVSREVVRVVTPGTVTDTAILSDSTNNYLGAISLGLSGTFGVAFADISTGEVSVTELSGARARAALETELGAFRPSEVLLSASAKAIGDLAEFIEARLGAMLTADRADLFDVGRAAASVRECFGDRAEALDSDAKLSAVGALLAYIRETQMTEPYFLRDLRVYGEGQYLSLDLTTLRNLELIESMRSKEKRGSLLWVLDKTETAMGGRMLRSWLRKPLVDPAAIRRRQSAVSAICEQFLLREELRRDLSGILDLERLAAKAVYGSANAKDLLAIAASLARVPRLRAQLFDTGVGVLTSLAEGMDPLAELSDQLLLAIVDDPPFTVREGGMIRDGYHAEVDRLRAICQSGGGWMSELEERERQSSGIRNLKVGYNRVFGYYIEVTKSQSDLVPANYVRKQTLTNCERYITEELKEMETTVLGASDKLAALEYGIFCELRDAVVSAAERIRSTAASIGELDVYLSFAEVAIKNRYTCPEVDSSDLLIIRDGRHPVVEKFVSDSLFVSNDTELDVGQNRLMLITGPNMAGKSTYMRQVALITVMAQIGSFVPAREARIGVVDKLFTRVGASDDLASGQSTFMLEMNEVSNILKNATRRSLIIYDEVGRGTSTYDGMSIARAVVEYTASRRIGAKTLFATHYHELTDLEGACEGVVNYHIAAKKRGDSITFLRKIVRGATDDSFGIEVAKLAGVPSEVVRRAREILSEIEEKGVCSTPRATCQSTACEPDMLAYLASGEAEEVADALRATDLDTLTPIEALNLVYTLKKKLTVRK